MMCCFLWIVFQELLEEAERKVLDYDVLFFMDRG